MRVLGTGSSPTISILDSPHVESVESSEWPQGEFSHNGGYRGWYGDNGGYRGLNSSDVGYGGLYGEGGYGGLHIGGGGCGGSYGFGGYGDSYGEPVNVIFHGHGDCGGLHSDGPREEDETACEVGDTNQNPVSVPCLHPCPHPCPQLHPQPQPPTQPDANQTFALRRMGPSDGRLAPRTLDENDDG